MKPKSFNRQPPIYFILGFISASILFWSDSKISFFSDQKSSSVVQRVATGSADRLNMYSVVRVVDGDTIIVSMNGKEESVRLIGVDTPEIKDPRKPVQCYGKEASDKMRQLTENKSVILEKDPTQSDRDIYKRLLRYVFLPDGRDVGRLLIEEGFGHEYTYQGNPHMYQKEYLSAEKYAMEAGKGLWAPNACAGN